MKKICDAIKTVDNLLGMGFFPGIEIASLSEVCLMTIEYVGSNPIRMPPNLK